MSIVTRIYGLVDPRTSSVFYVGRTTMSLPWRLQTHIRDANKRQTAKCRYIKNLLDVGLKPAIIKIDDLGVVTLEEAAKAEQAWIDFYSITCSLVNKGSSKLGGHRKLNKVYWLESEINLLGKISDAELSKILGCSQNTVSRERNRRNISAYSKFDVPLDKLTLEMLGKMSDVEIAKTVGCSPEAVRKIRIQRGIPACPQHKIIARNLPETVLDMLGKTPDTKVAEVAGLSASAIGKLRCKLGIPAFRYKKSENPQTKQMPEWVHKKLGTMPDKVLADMVGVSKNCVQGWRKTLNITSYEEKLSLEREQLIASSLDLLGTMSDQSIGEQISLSRSIVRAARQRRGIPANTKRKERAAVTMPKWAIDALGTVSDRHIADLVNLHHTTVACARKELGIPPYRGRGGKLEIKPDET